MLERKGKNLRWGKILCSNLCQMGTDLIARNSASRLKATLGLAFVDWVLLLCQLASNVTLRAPWAAGSRDKP